MPADLGDFRRTCAEYGGIYYLTTPEAWYICVIWVMDGKFWVITPEGDKFYGKIKQ